MANSYDNLKAEFVEWLKLGTKEARVAKGQPPTVLAWAEANKVDRVTCQRWKNDPEVKRAVLDHGTTLFTVDELRKARDKLVARAIEDGHVPAIKLMLDISGMSKQAEVAPEEVSDSAFSALTDEELAALEDDD